MGDRIDETVLIRKRTARRRFREQILSSWGSLCAYCGEREATTVDHVVPRHKGGQTVCSNLIAACRKCNHSKSSSDWITWYRAQSFWSQEQEDRVQKHLGSLNWTPDNEQLSG